jgi:hypothetical protein
MLVVAEFRNFLLPLVVMAPIPLTLIGIIPGHWLLGADFTATSMIGFIALSGIIVRNSILLVDFAKIKVQEGMPVRDAVVLAAEVRMRPIIITALALVIGSMVLLTDPIFQGMAVSLLFGSIIATFLTLVVIPLGCLSAHKAFCARDDITGRPGCHEVLPEDEMKPVTDSGTLARADKAASEAFIAKTSSVGDVQQDKPAVAEGKTLTSVPSEASKPAAKATHEATESAVDSAKSVKGKPVQPVAVQPVAKSPKLADVVPIKPKRVRGIRIKPE